MLSFAFHVLVPHPLLGAVAAILVIGSLGFLVKQIGVPVGIEIQKQPARFQDAYPLGIGSVGMRQVPGQIAADDRVKAPVRKIERFRVHLHIVYFVCQYACVFPCLFQHGGREINGSHITAQLAQDYCKEARAGTDLQNPQFLHSAFRELPRQFFVQAVFPLLPLRSGKLQFADLGVACGAVRPVTSVFLKDHSSIPYSPPSALSTNYPAWSNLSCFGHFYKPPGGIGTVLRVGGPALFFAESEK